MVAPFRLRPRPPSNQTRTILGLPTTTLSSSSIPTLACPRDVQDLALLDLDPRRGLGLGPHELVFVARIPHLARAASCSWVVSFGGRSKISVSSSWHPVRGRSRDRRRI